MTQLPSSGTRQDDSVGDDTEFGKRLRDGLAAGPLGVLLVASEMLALTDVRSLNPFDRKAKTKEELDQTRVSLLDGLVGVDLPETSATLLAFAALLPDDASRVRIQRELDRRRPALPRRIRTLGDAVVTAATEMTHVQGDGDDIFMHVRFPAGDEITIVVYIDHNLGTVVKDGFALFAAPVDVLARAMTSAEPDTTLRSLDLAEARARITEAIDLGARFAPPIESDDWPRCRPLVEWLLRSMPAGGTVVEPHEWTEAERDAIAGRFLASPYADALDEDQRDLLDQLVWFATGYGSADPMQWSPVRVEVLLDDWVPRKLAIPADVLRKFPDVLRAYVRYCDAERGLRPALTTETLTAVDYWEPLYLATIHAPRLMGPAALLAAAGALDPADYELVLPGEEPSFADYVQRQLLDAVGSEEVLAALDDEPLPDEDFAWEGIDSDIRPALERALPIIDVLCEALFESEFRTACRRFLAAAARANAGLLRGKPNDERTAGAVCWAVTRYNCRTLSGATRLYMKRILERLGLKGSLTSLADQLSRAAEAVDSPVTWLDSEKRAELLSLRDRPASYWD